MRRLPRDIAVGNSYMYKTAEGTAQCECKCTPSPSNGQQTHPARLDGRNTLPSFQASIPQASKRCSSPARAMHDPTRVWGRGCASGVQFPRAGASVSANG